MKKTLYISTKGPSAALIQAAAGKGHEISSNTTTQSIANITISQKSDIVRVCNLYSYLINSHQPEVLYIDRSNLTHPAQLMIAMSYHLALSMEKPHINQEFVPVYSPLYVEGAVPLILFSGYLHPDANKLVEQATKPNKI